MAGEDEMTVKERLETAQADLLFWITLFRSIFALSVGIGLLLLPDKSFPLATNFLGGFWVVGSLLSIRWGVLTTSHGFWHLLLGQLAC